MPVPPDDDHSWMAKPYAFMRGAECWIVVYRGALAFRFGPFSGSDAGAITSRCVEENIPFTLVMQSGPTFDWEFARELNSYPPMTMAEARTAVERNEPLSEDFYIGADAEPHWKPGREPVPSTPLASTLSVDAALSSRMRELRAKTEQKKEPS